jgi:hypothetical protein
MFNKLERSQGFEPRPLGVQTQHIDHFAKSAYWSARMESNHRLMKHNIE